MTNIAVQATKRIIYFPFEVMAFFSSLITIKDRRSWCSTVVRKPLLIDQRWSVFYSLLSIHIWMISYFDDHIIEIPLSISCLRAGVALDMVSYYLISYYFLPLVLRKNTENWTFFLLKFFFLIEIFIFLFSLQYIYLRIIICF